MQVRGGRGYETEASLANRGERPMPVERAMRVDRAMEMLHGGVLGAEVAAHMKESDRHPRGEGGAFAYLIETPAGSIFWKDSSGHWSGILRDLRPDVALLAAVGRGNVDGEPIQGTLAGSILTMDEAVRFCVTALGLDLAEALRMASLYPAAFLGVDRELGRIAPGFRANLVHLTDALAVTRTWIDGEAFPK